MPNPSFTIDLTTLPNYSTIFPNLGNYTITVKAEANNYNDSVASNQETYTKAPSGYTLTVIEYDYGGTFDITYSDDTTATVGEGTYNNVKDITGYTIANIPGSAEGWSVEINGASYYNFPYTLVGNTTASIDTYAIECFIKGTQISLADGTTKAIEDIKANDDILVWDFDNGELSSAKPAVVYDLGKTNAYEKLTFSDGSECNTIKHRLFNVDEGKFTYSTQDQFPIGSKTLNKNGEIVELVSREKIIDKEGIEYYNMRTKYYIDYFIDGVLSGTRLVNIYPIENLKYVKDNREIKPYEDFPRLTYEQYIDCRVGEQLNINREGDVDLGDADIQDYLLRLKDKNVLK